MNTFAIASFATAFLTVVLGILVSRTTTNHELKQPWVFFSISVAIWSFGFGMVTIAIDAQSALFWATVVQNPGAIFVPITFLRFIVVYLNRWTTTNARLIKVGYILAFLFLALNFTETYTSVRHVPQTEIHALSAGPYYPFYVLFFVVFVAASFYNMVVNYMYSQVERERHRGRYIILASILGFLGGASTFLLDFQVVTYPYGVYFIPFYVVFIAYGIIEHQLMDIQLAIKRGISYTVLLLTMLIPVYLLGIFLVSVMREPVGLEINLFSLTSMFTSFVALFFGSFVYLNNRSSAVNRLWLLFSLVFAAWSFSNGLLTMTTNKAIAGMIDRVGHLAAMFVPVTFLHFAVRLVEDRITGVRRTILALGYVSTGSFAALGLLELLFGGNILLREVRPILSFAYFTQAGEIYPIFFCVFLGLASYAMFVLLDGYRMAAGLRRNQIMYMLLASIIGFSGGMTNFLPAFGVNVYPYGNYVVPLYIFAMGYAIIRFRLMDVEVLAAKSLTYVIVMFCISIPAFLIMLWGERTYFGNISYSFSIFILILMCVVTMGFYIVVRGGGEEAIRGLIFRSKYDSYEILAGFIQAMVSILDLKELTSKLLETLSVVFEAEKVSLYLINAAHNRYEMAASKGLGDLKLREVNFGLLDPFPRWLLERRDVVLREEAERDVRLGGESVVNAMVATESELCIPLISRTRLIGFCNLGSKTSPKGFSYEDLRLLTHLSRQAAIAFENAMFFQDAEFQAEALKESEEKYRLLAEHARDIIFSLDNGGHFTFVNVRVQDILGFHPDELVGQPFTDLLKTDDARQMADLLGGKEPSRIFEMKCWRKGRDGLIPIEISMVARTDSTGMHHGWQGIARDISERRRMQEQLLRAEKLRALGEMATGVAHDFNNLLSVISNWSGVLLMRAQQADLCHGLEIIQKASLDGGETVRKLQNYTRTQGLREYRATDINQAVRDALAFTQGRWQNEASEQGIAYEIISELGGVPPVHGDISELREALTNLILNALDAMPKGGKLAVKTNTVRDKKEGIWIELQVGDTGHGMTREVKERLFDPFFTTKGSRGTGLGLSVVHSIVRRHRGEMEVESGEGKGTTFRIRLRPSSAPLTDAAGEDRIFGLPGRVLVIDDEPDVRDSIVAILHADSHWVTTAATGEEGVKAFENGRYDVIVTDLKLPGINGFEVARLAKSIDSGVSVILITGWATTTSAEEARRWGVDHVIAKPFKVGPILRLVAEVVARRRGKNFFQPLQTR